MSTLGYILGSAALVLVVWNMRRHELTDRRLRRPAIIATAVCISFLHGIPTSGADGALVVTGILLGIACGAVGALATRVERGPDGGVVATGTPLAVGVTVVAFGGRMAFGFAAAHGLGPAIARFSGDLGIHSAKAWIAALVLMAVADLAVRALILWRRREAVAHGAPWMPGLRAA
jgi:hypothetical protein